VNPAWVAALVALITLVLAVLGWILRVTWRAFKRVDQFLEDWNGRAGDSRGHVPMPGVMERLVRVEQSHARLETGLADIQGQVHLNGGGSLRDEVTRNTAAVGRLSGKVDRLHDSVEELRKAR